MLVTFCYFSALMKKTPTLDVLEKIKAGDERFLKDLYKDNRQAFISWLRRHFYCTEEEAKEVYQRAFSILYFNIKDEKVTNLSSSVETYLFGIGKNVLRRMIRSQVRESYSLDTLVDRETDELNYYEQEEQNHRVLKVKTMLERLGEPCKTILQLYYFKRFSMESIAERMGYKNGAVAKKKKFLCLQKLRDGL